MDVMNDKIMGFVPKSQYVKITYYLLLGSAIAGLFLSLMALIGVFIPLGGLVQLAGILGLVMALVGLIGFKKEFSSLDQSHLVYLAVLFGVFFVIGIIVAATFYSSIFLAMAVSFIIGLAQLLLLYTGYNSWKHGREITKDNIRSEVQLAVRRA